MNSGTVVRGGMMSLVIVTVIVVGFGRNTYVVLGSQGYRVTSQEVEVVEGSSSKQFLGSSE